jgi:Peptidase family C25/Subtilase family/FlgD Ig-like domain
MLKSTSNLSRKIAFVFWVVVFGVMTYAAGHAMEFEKGKIRFSAPQNVIEMPANRAGLVFDASKCENCRDSLPSYRFLGSLKIDSIINVGSVTRLSSLEQSREIIIKDEKLITAIAKLNPYKLVRRFTNFVPDDTLYWDTLLHEWKIFPDMSVHYTLFFHDSLDLDTAASWLSGITDVGNLGGFAVFEPDQLPVCGGLVTPWDPNDSLLTVFPTSSWYFKERNPDGSGGTGLFCAWGLMSNGRGNSRNIAILDSRVDDSHPDLLGKVTVKTSAPPDTLSGHGTKVAGVIAAIGNNTSGALGSAPDAQLFTYTDQDTLLNRYLTDGISMIVFSGAWANDTALLQSLSIFKSLHRIFVTSAGNISPGVPVFKYPAYWDSVTIAVGMVISEGIVHARSNYACDTCDFFVDVLAPVPVNTTIHLPSQGYEIFLGTSAAAPFAGGIIALLRHVRPDLTFNQIDSALEVSSNYAGAEYSVAKYGWGRIDAYELIKNAVNSAAPSLTLQLDSVACLVITADSLVSAFQELADYRTERGTPTIVKSVESIVSAGSGYAGVDDAEKIRECIKDYQSNNFLEYVILGGGIDIVQGRYVYSNLFGDGSSSLSDYYFACLDGDWNFDGDTLFGAVPDSVDLVAEVAVGRIPITNSLEIGSYIEKVKLYESPSDLSWVTEAFVIGSQQYSVGDGQKFSETIVDSFPAALAVTTMFDNGAGDVAATRANFLSEKNSGKGLILFHGLAQNSENFFVRRESTPYELIYAGDIDTLLDDSGYPSVVFSGTCWNAQFDATNIGASYINRPYGGAVAHISATYNDYTLLTHSLRKTFFGELTNGSTPEIGRLLNVSKVPFASDASREGGLRHSIMGYTLFGDPQLRIWTETPKFTTQDQLSTMVAGFSIVDTVLDSTTGLPIEGATVCLLKDPDYYEVGITDANGVAIFWPNFSQTGTATFTVTNKNYIASQANIAINQCSVLGDASNDCGFNIADVTFLMSWVFSGGPAPAIPNNADMDRSCAVNIADATYGVARIFSGGPAPLLGCVDSLVGFPKSVAGGETFDLRIPNDFEVKTDFTVSSRLSQDGSLMISLNSTHRLHGLSVTVRLADSSRASIKNLTTVPLHGSQRGSYVKIGLLDEYARNMLEPGNGDILEISNGAEIVKVLATEILLDGTVSKMTPGEVIQVDGGVGGSSGFSFDQNYPNPFNPETNFSFSLPKRIHVKIEVYNVLGQHVSTLIDGDYDSGRHNVKWDSTNDHGKTVASGVYFAKFVAGDFTAKRKMVIMK